MTNTALYIILGIVVIGILVYFLILKKDPTAPPGPTAPPVPTAPPGPTAPPVPSGIPSRGPQGARVPPPSIGTTFFKGLCTIDKPINIERVDEGIATHALTNGKYIELIGIPKRLLVQGALIKLDTSIFYITSANLSGRYIYGYFIDQSGNQIETRAPAVSSFECGERVNTQPSSAIISNLRFLFGQLRCDINSESEYCRVRVINDTTNTEVLDKTDVPIHENLEVGRGHITSAAGFRPVFERDVPGMYTVEVTVDGETKMTTFFQNFGKPRISDQLVLTCDVYPTFRSAQYIDEFKDANEDCRLDWTSRRTIHQDPKVIKVKDLEKGISLRGYPDFVGNNSFNIKQVDMMKMSSVYSELVLIP